ncbi:hypothetical protein [Mangrovibacterium lignilyticum]|uniref:hypothetical protein n=1 Tax=Mangrovibacterium lignilyticum TaxID=2668052 RepID=UPI0013D8A680|nr:hypothetical protein [Mangrovibacterium lignilyticum]
MKKLILPLWVIIFLIATTNAKAQNQDSTYSVGAGFSKYRFGGYGEILYQHMDYGADRYNDPSGAPSENRASMTIPRVVFTFDYKFTPDITFSSEVEFEYGGTGSALELEYEEFGEYEMEVEKAGEVVLEQIHLTKFFSPYFSVRVGHMIIPVGQTNNRHESILYYGTVRPESESSIIPLTWHETGLSILGRYRAWSYQIFVVNGLDANGFSSAYWVRDGKQGIFENVKMTDPAFAWRIENTRIRGLRLASSGYWGNSTGNTQKPAKMAHLDGRVAIVSGEFEYTSRRLTARGNVIYGDLTDSREISTINQSISSNIQYQRTPVAKNALAYGGEFGYNLYLKQPGSKLTPFVRYEYYNSMENTDGDQLADKRYQRDILTCGVNYSLNQAIALKADYSLRRIGLGDYNNENTFGLALVYTGWFMSK